MPLEPPLVKDTSIKVKEAIDDPICAWLYRVEHRWLAVAVISAAALIFLLLHFTRIIL